MGANNGKVPSQLIEGATVVNRAIATFNSGKYTGTVLFTRITEGIQIDINLLNFEPNTVHGFHIHKYGDLRHSCNEVCDHFNPYNHTHGGGHNPSHIRHVGDLGNITADATGAINETKIDTYISLDLTNVAYIIGRSIVIHQDADDCGLGIGDKKKDSLTTGNSGLKIACAVIGIAADPK